MSCRYYIDLRGTAKKQQISRKIVQYKSISCFENPLTGKDIDN